MSTVSEVLTGTYLEKLLIKYPEYAPGDFWSLICCGYDLKHPYEGWAGIVAVPIFSDQSPFELFFGEFPESLEQYENVPKWQIRYDVSKLQAFSEFRSYVDSISKSPVFISANAKTWALPIINEAVRNDVTGAWNAQLVCLRDLYSITNSEMKLYNSTFLGDAFSHAPKLPRTFGLHAIAQALGLTVPDSSNKARHRAQLTALCASSCLEHEYHLE